MNTVSGIINRDGGVKMLNDPMYPAKYHVFGQNEVAEWRDCGNDPPDERTVVLVYPEGELLYREGNWWHPVDADYWPTKVGIKKWMYVPDPNSNR